MIRANASDLAVCGVLTLVGGLIRYLLLYTQSLTMDESLSLNFAYASTRQLITNVLHFDTHPPLYYLIVHFAYYVLGMAPIDALRIPSFLAATLTIPVMYALGRSLIGRAAAYIAAALTACSPIAVWYSHDGRMYAITWFFTLLSYLLLVMVKRRAAWPWTLAYALSVALALYADISSWLAMLPQALVVAGGLTSVYLGAQDKMRATARIRGWLRALVGYLGGWLLFLPWLVVFPQQLALIRTIHVATPSLPVYWGLLLDDLGLTASYALLGATVPPVASWAMLATFALAGLALIWASAAPRYRLYASVTAALTFGVAAMFFLLILEGSRSVLISRVVGIGAFGLILLAAGGIAALLDNDARLGTQGRSAAARGARLAQPYIALALLIVVVVGMAAALTDMANHDENGSRSNVIAAQNSVATNDPQPTTLEMLG